ncbi:uncharacterized protein F4812DRAFT_446814 [Daldinia caldariorum]|uniref:uncharacterized protein n=1 Tax=Daldinia caldariorum TaxID=326644 RepID=UPI002008CE43|nr:uncharacterized protein F4812DRAFT_446814 [Daldinia caldariorum]KAI1463404.1 hypothetical protein F4812DRAFT_446814 [Daldinia caldariorum]
MYLTAWESGLLPAIFSILSRSCEPCRRSKLKCDHVVPTCGRCIKRQCADRCIYHPNPLTQARQKEKAILSTQCAVARDKIPQVPVQSSEVPVTESSGVLTSQLARARSTEVATREVHRAASAPPLQSRDGVANRTINIGFLGETSYVSIFTDGLGSFDVSSPDLESSPVQGMSLSHDRIAQGCKVLAFLKDKHMINRMVSRWYEISEDEACICIEPIMKEWLWGLGMHHGDVLKDQNPEKIQRLCELIWRNTQSPISFTETTTAKQWARLGTGPSIRWEVIGLIAVIAGLSANTPEPFGRGSKKHSSAHSSFARQMNEIAEVCLSFCRECGALGDMFTWLLIENYALTAKIKGEASHSIYTLGGEIVASVVGMGLHRGVKEDDHLPFFLIEVRKRLLCQMYGAEIGMSTFTGRPPRISHRYCNLQPPLDLSVSQLLLEGDDLTLALASLDEKGFNTSGRIRRVTWIRIWIGFAIQREDILDLALGPYTREEILQRAEDIKARHDRYIEELPPFARKIKDSPIEIEGRQPAEILVMIVIHQAFHSNQLLLQRVLIRKAGASSEELICLARSILKDILLISQRRDLGTLLKTDIASLLAVQGMRSAAVMAVELLKQEQLPVYPRNPLLPRSQTIQDLAVFAAVLGAVDPSDGSFSICDQGRKVITQILDRILSPPDPPKQRQGSREPSAHKDPDQQVDETTVDNTTNDAIQNYGFHISSTADFTMTDLNYGIDAPFLGPDNDFMQWLENMDWERPV